MADQKVLGALAPASLTPKEYSFAQIFNYFQYIMDLCGDGYPMNIMTPDEFERGEFDGE